MAVRKILVSDEEMRFLLLLFVGLTLQGCIYTQKGLVRNETDRLVFVGSPAGSNYTRIAARQIAEVRFVYCLLVSTSEGSWYYGIPQVTGGVYFDGESISRIDAPSSNVPADAYRKSRRLYDVALVFTNEGLFFDSTAQGLVPVVESEDCAESKLELDH